MKAHIVVIGGGASGLIAAIRLKQLNANVTLIERNNKLGKKILATGNGRCNFTNVLATEQDYNRPNFVKETFNQFGVKDTISFFESLGIIPKTEELGKTYPLSEQASSITDVLIYEVKRLGVNLLLETSVIFIKKGKTFTLKLSTGKTIEADKVILSTGGKAMPLSGSDGSGYQLATNLGHHMTDIFPALVKLELESPHLKHMDGVKFKGEATLIHNNHILQVEQGDILFTKYGISGPTILQLSRKANALLLDYQTIFIKVQLINGIDEKRVMDRFLMLESKTIEDGLVGLIHKKLIKSVLKEVGIFEHTLIKDIPNKQLNKLVKLLFDWRFKVIGSKDFDDAQVTAGGIVVEEINPKTLESNLVRGLYFTGEIIDIDGLCGGYNLQWAWSSGYVAATHAGGLND